MPTNLKKLLAGELATDELAQLVGSFDVVGDIAVVRVPEALLARSSRIAEAILSTDSRLKTVVRRVGPCAGEYRLPSLQVIGGEESFETEVVEFGLRCRLNLQTCYFSVRSGAERKRVADQVDSAERVLVLFSGIAPYPLMIAKQSGAQVVGVEKNPQAHRFAVDNVRRNRLQRQIELHCADALAFVAAGSGRKFERIVMPLPTAGTSFLPAALRLLAPGGMLHFYTMAATTELEAVGAQLQQLVNAAALEIETMTPVKAGHCGNRLFRWCFDLNCTAARR